MILTSYWGLTFNPFEKGIATQHLFESSDYRQFASRMEYFKEAKGFAVIHGEPGSGKTTSIRTYIAKLNPQVYRVIYLPLSSVTVVDFYRHLALGLGLVPRHRKVDLFHQIQEQIANLAQQKGVTPLMVLDEAQYFSHGILNDLRLLFNFHMDSKNYAMVLLAGQPYFLAQLNLHIHEALRQRIVVHYEFAGLKRDEIPIYVTTLLQRAGLTEPIFTPDGIEALTGLSGGLPRKLNRLAEKAMLVGCHKNVRAIDSGIVQLAQDDIELMSSR